MIPQIKELGKVVITPAGYWIKDKAFEHLDLVTNEIDNKSYIAKQNVPAGIEITNVDYWQPIGASGYRNNNFIILSDTDEEGNLKEYNLSTAIATISNEDKRPGIVLGFYGIDRSEDIEKPTWYLYQFNSNNIYDWNNLDKWIPIYDNVNKFKGFFRTENELKANVGLPKVGDYAYIGDSVDNAILWLCTENGKWTNTNTYANFYAHKTEAVYSKDFSELEYNIDEQYSDRAEKDALGRIIHMTYLTKEGVMTAIRQMITKAVAEINLPPNCVHVENLDESVKQLIGNANITNLADNEDIVSKEVNGINVLKFADKEYSQTAFSGMGRVYLRKNMVDGINVLEQYMINKPNTIYIVQYDYCMNGATIEIPENCVLKFEGGSINRGAIIGNDTILLSYNSNIKNNVELNGTWNTSSIEELISEYNVDGTLKSKVTII